MAQLEQLFSLPETMKLSRYSRASLYRKMADGSFPKAVRVGQRAIAWRESDLLRWQQERFAESRGE